MNCYFVLAVSSAVLGMFQSGYNQNSINQPQENIQQFLNISFKDRYNVDLASDSLLSYFSIAVSAFNVGEIVGVLFLNWFADVLGRQKGLLYTQIFSILGAIFMGSCRSVSSYEMLVIGRLLVGISSGLLIGLSVTYVVEIAPIRIRGLVGAFSGVALSMGILIANILGMEQLLGGTDAWPILLSLTWVPSLLQCIMLPFMPESPRYLILFKGQIKIAEKALKKLRQSDNVKTELKEILKEGRKHDNVKKYSIWQLLLSSDLRLALVAGCCLQLSQPLCGISSIQYYSTSFYGKAGMTSQFSQYATIGMGVVGTLTILVSALILMERLGRRTLILGGLGGLTLCLTMITLALNNSGLESSVIFLTMSLLLSQMFYSLGTALIPAVAVAELFSQGPRAAAMSVTIFLNKSTSLLVSLAFPQMMIHLLDFSFVPFIIFTTILCIIIYFYFPETKNRTTNEISHMYNASKGWRSAVGLKDSKWMRSIASDNDDEYDNNFVLKDRDLFDEFFYFIF